MLFSNYGLLFLSPFLLLLLPAAYALSESLTALGLLGSHLGVPGIPASYDYVIVGGGTAGLTFARRLAANPAITVAVLEAGDFYEFSNGNFSEVPAYATQFTGSDPVMKNPGLDWYMYTEPQSVCISFSWFDVPCCFCFRGKRRGKGGASVCLKFVLAVSEDERLTFVVLML